MTNFVELLPSFEPILQHFYNNQTSMSYEQAREYLIHTYPWGPLCSHDVPARHCNLHLSVDVSRLWTERVGDPEVESETDDEEEVEEVEDPVSSDEEEEEEEDPDPTHYIRIPLLIEMTGGNTQTDYSEAIAEWLNSFEISFS
jgi:hypothetical protein